MLKRITIFILLLYTVLPHIAKAQTCNYVYSGSKTLYTNPSAKNIAAPLGYQPVFINYVGRHGARHLTKDVKETYTYALITIASSAKQLSPAGEKLKWMMTALNGIEHGKTGNISDQGKFEQEDIGRRILEHYPQLFKNRYKIKVAITKEARTRQSAEAFFNGMKRRLKDTTIKVYTDDTQLRFYDFAPAYTTYEDSGNWQKGLSILQQKLNLAAINKKIVQRWFIPAFIKTMKPGEADKIVDDVFGLATIAPSLKAEVTKAGYNPAEINFASLFTCDELTALSKVDVADDYLLKGPGADINGIQVKIAAPLLVDFINGVDIYLNHPDTTACIRFAHAETIAPFATLLGIAQASIVAKDLTKLDAAWQSSKIIPLSANIQWIVYSKKGSNDLVIKVLLNEQDVHINGLTTKTFPYYKWSDMRKLYIDKLNKLHVSLDGDMSEYLKNVK
jgi:multiple inositol-polyphosphate phosphatase/2,3-bisphosphoglycerate 3-phosphatase